MSTPVAPAGEHSVISSRVAGYGLFIPTGVFAVNFIDRKILVILQEPMKAEMGHSDAQLGLLSQAFRWRMAFMAVGLPGIALALVLLVTVQEPPRGRWESESGAAFKPGLTETLVLLSTYRSFWYLAAASVLTSFVSYGNGNFTPSFLVRVHEMELLTSVSCWPFLEVPLGLLVPSLVGVWLIDWA